MTITYREWRWVVVVSLVVLVVTSLPYLWAGWLATPGQLFSGFVLGVDDGNSYLAKMRLGADGAWQFHLFYTTEPHPGAYLFLFHLLLGKLARLFHLPLLAVYHAARLFFAFGLLLMVYRFTAQFVSRVPVRRLAFGLVAAGSGLGWLVILTGQLERIGLPLDFYLPEAFTFHLIFALPHLSLALSLLLAAMLFTLAGWNSGRWRLALTAGVCLLLLAVIAAFYYFVFAAVIGGTLLLRAWQARKLRFKEVGQAALALALAAPLPAYYAGVVFFNPVYWVWAQQHNFQSPPPLHYALAFGLLLALAAVGLRHMWRERESRPDSLLLLSWALVIPLLVYLPGLTVQRRLTLGYQVALAGPAALGVWRLWQSLSARWPALRARWSLAAVGLVALAGISNLLILAGVSLEATQRRMPIYQPAANVAAADWLAAHVSAEPVLLAAYNTANMLPTRAAVRTFIGHGPETLHGEQKRAQVEQFFAAATSNAWQQDFLRRNDIRYLFYGPEERVLGPFLPGQVSFLQKVYDNGQVQVYRVSNGADTEWPMTNDQ